MAQFFFQAVALTTPKFGQPWGTNPHSTAALTEAFGRDGGILLALPNTSLLGCDASSKPFVWG